MELATLLYDASHSCQPALSSTNSLDGASQVFVETVLLGIPSHLANIDVTELSKLSRHSDVRLLGTPHVIGKLDLPATITLEQHVGVLERATFTRMSVIARRSEADQHVLEFELGFSLPNSDPTRKPELASSRLMIAGVTDRAMLGFADYPGDPQRKVLAIAKAYPVRGSHDLRAIFECKMRLRQRAIEQR